MRPLAPCFLIPLFLSGCYAHYPSVAPRSTPGSMRHYSNIAKSPIEPPRGKNWRSRKPDPSFASRERYQYRESNAFRSVSSDPLSTFSVDVDTASYANVRRMIRKNLSIPSGAIRVEEMINYFDYNYPAPGGDIPFSMMDEVATCPWNPRNKLVRIALQGKEMPTATRAPANLVFLVDVSGSMKSENKLPLLKRSLQMLTNQLRHDDRVAIVVYAGSSGVALPSTPCSDTAGIHDALDRLEAGGSTAGGAGLNLAYRIARENFQKSGANRVILATDGDFNVGPASDSALVSLIEKKAKSGVHLSVLGFGMGNYNDSMLEKLSNKGNGNYAYIDTLNEARKVLVRETQGSLVTIAKDVKIQVEFNPKKVKSYRLVGYENRMLENEDFSNDKKDAGEIGAGHQVTAFYEIVPANRFGSEKETTLFRYRKPEADLTEAADSNELLHVRLRYKSPNRTKSKRVTFPVADSKRDFSRATTDFRFAASVAAFGMKLRASGDTKGVSRARIQQWASQSTGPDRWGYRKEFLELVKEADF